MRPIDFMRKIAGLDPNSLENLIQRDPKLQNNQMAQNALRMLCKKDTKGFREMGENLCRERNLSEEDAKKMALDLFKNN